MADRQSGSVWTHYDGSVLTGPLLDSGARLTIEPIIHTTWQDWQAEHPDTLVLDWYPEFADRYRENIEIAGSSLGPQFQDSLLNTDDRLVRNELVLGVNIGNEYRAYVLNDFPSGLQLVADTLHDFPIIVLVDSDVTFALAFLAQLEGQPLVFSIADGQLTDELGNSYDRSGKAISGPSEGAQLVFVTSFVTEWYGWSAYHPDTEIYGQPD